MFQKINHLEDQKDAPPLKELPPRAQKPVSKFTMNTINSKYGQQLLPFWGPLPRVINSEDPAK